MTSNNFILVAFFPFNYNFTIEDIVVGFFFPFFLSIQKFLLPTSEMSSVRLGLEELKDQVRPKVKSDNSLKCFLI
jgi:hypothetical protein